jgi:hypothetical protein
MRWGIGGKIKKIKLHKKMCMGVFISMLPKKLYKLHIIFKPDFSKTGRRYSRLSWPADSGVSV